MKFKCTGKKRITNELNSKIVLSYICKLLGHGLLGPPMPRFGPLNHSSDWCPRKLGTDEVKMEEHMTYEIKLKILGLARSG